MNTRGQNRIPAKLRARGNKGRKKPMAHLLVELLLMDAKKSSLKKRARKAKFKTKYGHLSKGLQAWFKRVG